MPQSYWKVNLKDAILLGCFLIGLLVVFLINPETIPAGGGFGFDGVTYARMVSEIDEMISNGELSEYYAQRILPSLMVRAGLTSLGLSLGAENIIGAFRIMNGLLMVAALVFWMLIAQRIRLTPVAFWIGIAGLILIFPSAKQLFYYPVLTDTFALAIGLAMVWAHLTGRTVLVAAIAIVGAMGWQMAGIVGMALVASTLVTAGPTDPSRAHRLSGRLVVATLAISSLLGAAIGLPYLLATNLEQVVFQSNFSSDPFLRLLTNIPALALAGCFVANLLACVIATRWKLHLELRQVATILFLLAAIVAIPNTFVRAISNPQIPPPGLTGYGEILAALLVSRVREALVLLPVVSHAVYYGPVFLLLLLLWKRAGQMTVELGAGFVFVIAIFVVLSVFAESRFTFLLWPFVVAVVCKVLSATGLPRLTQGLVALGAIGLSKVWLIINQGPWPKPDYDALFEWPKSVYFSSLGPWMSVENYLIQGSIVAVLFLLIYVTMKRGNAVHSVSFGRK